MSKVHAKVWLIDDLAAMLDALQSGRPDYGEAFDVLRIALHIEPPAQQWHVIDAQPRRRHLPPGSKRIEAQP